LKTLVTGGGGFLGGAIVRRLVNDGHQVRAFQRAHYPKLDTLGVEQIRGDVADAETVDRAVRGVDVVFHVAAKVDMWGPYEPFRLVNVVGTENVLAAMRRHCVPKLVFTSSPSVVHGRGDLEGVDESVPYPDTFDAAYPATKAIAEQTVIAANSPELATIALRPHLIWGPGDTNLVPRIIARARAGQLRLVGDGSNLVDTVYIDNAMQAHLLAADCLEAGAPCAGRAYFISNGDPRPLKEIINGILAAADLPPVERSVPRFAAVAAGAVLETAHRLLPLKGEPRMTRVIAEHFATSHWYDIGAARRDFGYEPEVSIEEGLRRLADWLATLEADRG
jgi:nucleoside-diphosphate-sugar epimerase